MDKTIFIFAVIMLLSGVLTIATASIGMECYNYSGMVNTKYGNYVFMGLNLGVGLIATLASFPAFYMAFTM